MGRESKSMMGTVGTIPVHWLVAVAMVYALALVPSPTLVAAGPGVVVTTASTGAAMSQCDNWELCNAEASCDTPCLSDLWETTCGEYQGGVWDGYCAGDCGDGLCNLFVESSLTCSDDCGSPPPASTCGADGCEVGENCINCSLDCGACPTNEPDPEDGICSPEYENPAEYEECLFLGVCSTSNDCIAIGPHGYSCVNQMCVPNSLPIWAVNCSAGMPCTEGFVCTTHPLFAPFKVCLPDWASQ